MQEWRTTIDLNLDSVFLSCKAAASHMLAQQRGRIVNIASGLGARVVVNQSAFSAAQAGVIHLTRALGLEWARDNVRVNAIVGGWIVDSDDALPDKIRRYVPMQRWGRPEDLGWHPRLPRLRLLRLHHRRTRLHRRRHHDPNVGYACHS